VVIDYGGVPKADSDGPATLRITSAEAVQAAHKTVLHTALLTRLLTALSEPAPLPLLLDRALSTLSELFSADIVTLVAPNETGRFAPVAAIGLPEDIIDRPLSNDENGYILSCIRTSAPILITEAGNDPKVDAQLKQLGAETAVWLPVSDSFSPRGALLLVRCNPVPFTSVEVGLLSAMAYRIGLVLEQAQRNAQLEQIIRANHEIGRHLDAESIGSAAVRFFSALMGADAAALVLKSQEGISQCVSQLGLDGATCSTLCRMAEHFPADQPFATDVPYLTLDLEAAAHQLSLELPDRFPVKTLLTIPLRLEGRLHGLLFAVRFSKISFSPGSMRMAMLYSGQLSAALENANLYKALRDELVERERAEKQRKLLEARLFHAQRMNAMATFSSGIVHDFNNLLGAIIGNIDLAQMDPNEKDQSHCAIEQARNAAMQAAGLVRKFMTFSAGGNPSKVITSARRLITDAVSLSISGSNVNVDFDLPDDLAKIEVDQAQMKQALSNIIVNAIEAMPNGGTIRVSAGNATACPDADMFCRESEKVPIIEFVITDQGKGVAPENLAKIFDPYFSTKQRGSDKGMGLGLAIAHSIIAKHKGEIRVESQLDAGTTFYISLPACRMIKPEKMTMAAEEFRYSGAKTRVLMLEDEEALAEMNIRMLQYLGYEDVEHALVGEDAVKRFLKARQSGVPFNLLILDLTVKGGIGGKEVIKIIKKIDEGVRAIVVSGYSNDPVMDDYAGYGFCGSLRKPYGLNDLRAILETVVGYKNTNSHS
jgi:signal transduction histidine kinase/ActR/RegA family two-component response regulator